MLTPNAVKMNNTKAFLVTIGVITLGLGLAWSKRVQCSPYEADIDRQLDRMGDTLVIREVILFGQPANGFRVNLVPDTVVIRDTADLCVIQEILFERRLKSVNHPVGSWQVYAEVVLVNNDHLSIKIEKIMNDSADSVITYFSFAPCARSNNETYYSQKLGKYLEERTNFDGILYE